MKKTLPLSHVSTIQSHAVHFLIGRIGVILHFRLHASIAVVLATSGHCRCDKRFETVKIQANWRRIINVRVFDVLSIHTACVASVDESEAPGVLIGDTVVVTEREDNRQRHHILHITPLHAAETTIPAVIVAVALVARMQNAIR